MFKKRAIKKYILVLPPELKKRYGGIGPYSEGQVRTTVESLGLSKKYMSYAIVLFCAPHLLIESGYDDSKVESMSAYLAAKFASGSPIGGGDVSSYSGSGDFGGFGDGGGADGGGGGDG